MSLVLAKKIETRLFGFRRYYAPWKEWLLRLGPRSASVEFGHVQDEVIFRACLVLWVLHLELHIWNPKAL